MLWDEIRCSAFPFAAFDFCPFHVVRKQQGHFTFGSCYGHQAEASGAGAGEESVLLTGLSGAVRSRGQLWREASV